MSLRPTFRFLSCAKKSGAQGGGRAKKKGQNLARRAAVKNENDQQIKVNLDTELQNFGKRESSGSAILRYCRT